MRSTHRDPGVPGELKGRRAIVAAAREAAVDEALAVGRGLHQEGRLPGAHDQPLGLGAVHAAERRHSMEELVRHDAHRPDICVYMGSGSRRGLRSSKELRWQEPVDAGFQDPRQLVPTDRAVVGQIQAALVVFEAVLCRALEHLGSLHVWRCITDRGRVSMQARKHARQALHPMLLHPPCSRVCRRA